MKSGGVTLLELLVVLAILGIIASIGSISYIGWINTTRADAAAAEFGRLVDRAKARVRTSNQDVRVTITTATNTVNLSQGGTSFGSSRLDATMTALDCRPACTTTFDVLAPFGTMRNDVKLTLRYSNKIREVYSLGPTGLLKIVRR